MPQIGEKRRINHQTQIWIECEWCHNPRWVGIRHEVPRSKRCIKCSKKQYTAEELKIHSREYQHRFYQEHKDHINEVRRQLKQRNPERYARIRRQAFKRGRNQLRRNLIEKLGSKCIRCGIDDWRVLQIDHINGDGHKERKKCQSYTIWLRALKEDTGKYQLLCANCNVIKAREAGEYAKAGRHNI